MPEENLKKEKNERSEAGFTKIVGTETQILNAIRDAVTKEIEFPHA